ncbi:MAG: SH3 domain-containing protein [Candidatus Eremiobacteraeota bacterium]|nr:SH3 domain-containing protein [Candidatus Eremiobacteraeota bacterium]
MKKNALLIVFLLLLLAVTCAVPAWAYEIAAFTDKGPVNVHLLPDKNSRVLTTVNKGELCLVLNRKQGDWWQVFALHNTIGYVHKSKLVIRWNDGKSIATINDQDGYAIMYTGASQNTRIIRKVMEGEEFIVVGKDAWYRIVTNDCKEGFVLAGKVVELYPMP